MWRRFVHQTCTRSEAVDSSRYGNDDSPELATPTSQGFRSDEPGNPSLSVPQPASKTSRQPGP